MSTRYPRQIAPSVAPWVAISISVTAPPLTSDSKSVLLSNLCTGNTTHSHGPSIFGPPFWKSRICVPNGAFIFSRNPSKGEKSEMLLLQRHLAMLSWLTLASGDMSDMLLSSKIRPLSLLIPQGRDIRYVVALKIQTG